ncbi:MAG: pentapeptide repeat-containing protein [Rickettsiaceae bacterium]
METSVEQESRVSLNDAAMSVIKAGDDGVTKQKLTKLIDRNILFDGVNIGSSKKQVKLQHLDINNSFVNSKFNNVSFQGSKFSNASFTGATFIDTDFNKTEMDGITFQSLIPALKNGSISLKGVKIVGDMPYALDLSDISLKGIDFSAVTSMSGVNLKNADFRGGCFTN